MSIKACGIIVHTRINQQQKFLVIQQHAGHWGFPKGHQEKDETYLQTAQREVKEETGLQQINIIPNFQISEFYQVKENDKEVIYFLAHTKQSHLNIQPEEIAQYAWLNQEETLSKLTFQGSKDCFQKALEFLSKNQR